MKTLAIVMVILSFTIIAYACLVAAGDYDRNTEDRFKDEEETNG